MVARTRPHPRVAAVALAALFLAGCTGGGDSGDSAEATGKTGAAAATEASGPGSATAADQVMAEQTSAAPGALGGDLTLTLRAVEVGGGNMTVRWALRWDNDDAAQDATVSYGSLGISPTTLVTDRAALTAYRPYCTEGSWQLPEDASAWDRGYLPTACASSMLVSPRESGFEFPNHGTIESWAILPAPEGNPATVDVAPLEGLPLFTDATVNYLDGGAE